MRVKTTSNQQTGCLVAFGVLWVLMSSPFVFIFPLVGVPFAAIGVAFICWGLAPKIREMKITHPECTVSQDMLRLGDSFTFRMHQIFKSDLTVDSATVKFMMRESATYTRGTDTYTDKHEVLQRAVTVPGRMYRAGEILRFDEEFEVPADAMHTFNGNKNKIEWLVTLEVKIARWPDVKEEYPVVVLAERAG